MGINPFDTESQKANLDSRLVVGLERVSEVFRVLLWDHAKELGLSPIQIQLLIFIDTHDSELCTVSHLAKEFNMTKATVSDAIRVMDQKELVVKVSSSEDARSYVLTLSKKGSQVIRKVQQFASPIEKSLEGFSQEEKQALYHSLAKLIFQLHKDEVIEVQRTCFGCKFYEKRRDAHYCTFIKESLKDHEIRLDCEDYVF